MNVCAEMAQTLQIFLQRSMLNVGCSMFVLLSSCDRKETETEKAAPPREARAAAPRSAPSEKSAADLAADSLSTAIGSEACFKAASELAKSGSVEAVKLLLDEATSRQDEAEAAAILDALSHLTSPQAINTLAEQSIRGSSPAVFKTATEVIADRADSDTVDLLTNLLYDRPASADRTHKVRIVLQSIRNPPATRALGKLLLTAQEPGVIESAATALGHIATPSARVLLEQALKERTDLTPGVRDGLQRTLEGIVLQSGE